MQNAKDMSRTIRDRARINAREILLAMGLSFSALAFLIVAYSAQG